MNHAMPTEHTKTNNLPVLRAIKDVADYLRIDPKSVRRLIKSKHLAAYKVGRQWRIADEDLRALDRKSVV